MLEKIKNIALIVVCCVFGLYYCNRESKIKELDPTSYKNKIKRLKHENAHVHYQMDSLSQEHLKKVWLIDSLQLLVRKGQIIIDSVDRSSDKINRNEVIIHAHIDTVGKSELLRFIRGFDLSPKS